MDGMNDLSETEAHVSAMSLSGQTNACGLFKGLDRTVRPST